MTKPFSSVTTHHFLEIEEYKKNHIKGEKSNTFLLTPNKRDLLRVCVLSSNFGRFRCDSSPVSVDLLFLLIDPFVSLMGDSENLAKGLSNC